MGLKQPKNLRLEAKTFSFQHYSCAFLRTYMLVLCCKSNVIFELSFQFVWMNSHGSLNVVLPSSPWVIHSGVQLTRLNCLLWLSIRLSLLSQVLPFISIIHSSPLTYHFPWWTIWHWLRPVLFIQPYVYFTLADPATPISPTYVAADYPLCKSFVNSL